MSIIIPPPSTCTVSVVIPMYNAENFIGACLESVLNQTLKNFEVIVVDDCSTDSSLAVAESYLERFGGRLKIISLPKNSGSGAIPRNEGLKFSRGEYIFFMDDDDLILNNALEVLYDAAEKFSADVIHMEQCFECDENDAQDFTRVSLITPKFIRDKILMESYDIGERIEMYLKASYSVFPWAKFSRRDFLIANDINFPHIKISEDILWTTEIICLAKNFLRVPTPLYVWRKVKNSWSRVERNPSDKIKFWLDPLIEGLNYLDEFMDGIEFFARNPDYRFKLTKFIVDFQMLKAGDSFHKLNRYELYDLIHKMFSGKHSALIANLIVMNNLRRNELTK